MHYLIPVIGQRTYEELRNYLKLPVLRKERIIIKVFGTEGSSLKTVDVVPLKLLSSSKKIVVEALCTPTICSNILNEDVKIASNHYEHLKNLQLADFSSESNKCIDFGLLLNYYSCILGETKVVKDIEPFAVNSHFDWIICGHYENYIVSNKTTILNRKTSLIISKSLLVRKIMDQMVSMMTFIFLSKMN